MGNKFKKVVKKRKRLQALREHMKNIRKLKRPLEAETPSLIPLQTIVEPDQQNQPLEAETPSLIPLQTIVEPDQQNHDRSDTFTIEVETKESDQFQPVSGRRIVDLNFLLHELQEKARHSDLFDCKMNYFCLIGEKRVGLTSVFKFQCNLCKNVCLIHSEDPHTQRLNLNISATTGIIASGIGFSQFDELCSSMDIPIFSPKYYNKLQNEVYAKWEETASAEMEAAAIEEKDMAIAEGRIKGGYPVIDVYVDGSWCARSYGTNYKASSGTAAIIGRKTGKILYIGVKNKYCLVCARAANKNSMPNNHVCFKNFEGSSSSMETEILIQGFKTSISMYGLIYNRMIGDGDASTYFKILSANPYESANITVEKIECRNHVLRNFCKKLRFLTTETKYLLAHRKTLTNLRIMSMRKVIVKCIKHHKDSNNPRDVAISVLHKDIINSMLHAYGDHKMCQSYYCEHKENKMDDLKKVENTTFAFRLNAIVSSIAAKSRSLIEDVDTNIVECFNNVIAKFIGGKRINYALKQGYQGRCSAAVVSFNTKSHISTMHKALTGKYPGGKIDALERRKAIKRKYFVEHPIKKKRILKDHNANKKQHDYGPVSSAPDMSDEDLKTAQEEFLKNLEALTIDKVAIERATVLQRDSSEWLEIRKKLITASNFGPICKRKTLNTANLVRNILYKKNLAHVASISHGIENEKQALLQLQRQENVIISPCGIFIDQIHAFIGATPDGLIDDNMIVEIKCPMTASKMGLNKAIEENKIQILKYNKNMKTYTINKTSNWYYQIQGQLHVTRRQACLLGIWAGENEPLYTNIIDKDDDFWNKNMEPKLLQFYKKCLLPEIVDSRKERGMPIRNLQCVESKENNQPQICASRTLSMSQTDSHSPGLQQPGPSTRVIDFNCY